MKIMKDKTANFFAEFLPEFIIGLLFIVVQYLNINLDFWNDEIYTLKHFTFTDTTNIFLDYHVPNNHILFNLINHLYLSLIGIESLFQLMDRPYFLRVVPFVYSAFTLLFTYKIALKAHSRTIALISSIILITTIPFLNFSLQIRGYGLSMLLLTMIIYYGFSYLKKPQIKHLILVGVTTAFLVYTIPSNLYFVFCILLVYGIFFLKNLIKTQANNVSFTFSKIISDFNFKVIIASIFGLILSLAFYAPIFKDVFMNEYVVGGNSFEFGKLRFYIPHLFEGFVSGKWFILVLATIGFLLKIISRSKWTFPFFIYLSLLIIPLVLVYLRGDSPPLRVFVVILPFVAILFASSILQIWTKIKQLIPLHDYYLVFGIFLYSVLVLQLENQKINDTVLSDLHTGSRSQDLYRQYYSHHYQPLLDVDTLSKEYQKNQHPILIFGCEPHGVPNYLEKFQLPYFTENHLDSLLITNDKIYIVTNSPNLFTGLEEYLATPLIGDLSYHSTFLFEKKNFVKKAILEIDSLQQQLGDSVGFVFNTFANSIYSNRLKTSSFLPFSDETQFGDLITLSKQKKYLCYLSTRKFDSAITHTIVHDHHNITQEFNRNSVSQFQLLRIDSNSNSALTKSEKLDASKTYSTAFTYNVDLATNQITFKVSFSGEFVENSKGVIVLSIDRNGESLVWKGQFLNKFYQANIIDQTVITAFEVTKELLPGDHIKIYVWNAKKEAILVNNFQVELVSK